MSTTSQSPRVSFVLATHDRREVALRTLRRLSECGLDRPDFEVIVVDNASTDGAAEAIAEHCDTLVRLSHNAGSCAKSYGVAKARGRYIVFLDDDSCPRPGSVERMMQHFEADANLGAAGFTVHLPDGRQEGGALPDVFLGCGVGFRAEALRGVGGLDVTFFMQAEEYDLAFRLAGAGRRVRMFDDLHVDHLKTACARKSDRTTFYDIRNNLRVIARHLPTPWFRVSREDLLQRYYWLATRDGHRQAFVRGAWAGLGRGVIERRRYRGQRLTPDLFERFYRSQFITERMAELRNGGVRRIVFADLGKNVYAFHRGAAACGLNTVCIGDDRFALPGRAYRGVPIVPLEAALRCDCDAVVVANSSPVHGAVTRKRVAGMTTIPVHHWFSSPDGMEKGSPPPVARQRFASETVSQTTAVA